MAPNLQVFYERNTLSLISPILARFPSVQSERNSDYSGRPREKNWPVIGSKIGIMKLPPSLPISALSVSLIAQIHEHKGALRSMTTLAPEQLQAMRQIATLESVGAGIRLGSSVLSDAEVSHAINMLRQREPHDQTQVGNTRTTAMPVSGTTASTTSSDFSAELLTDYEIDELLMHQIGRAHV